MKILVHDYAGHPFQVQLSRQLARGGHDVLHAYAGALQTPRGELVRREDDPPGFDVTEVPMDPDYAKHKYSFRRRRSMEIRYGHSAAKLIDGWSPEVVLSSNTPTEPQSSILKACKKGDRQFVFWCQDFYSIAVDKLVRKKIPVLGRLIGSYYKRLERRQLRASDHVVAITEDFKPIMVGEFGVDPDKISVIPNWAPIDNIPLHDKANTWSREQGLDDKYVFLYTGTLGMKHNPELLLAVAAEFRDRPDVRVVVISEGIGADWLREERDRRGLTNLVLLPYQPFSVLPEVLAAGDVLTGVLEEDAGVFSVPSKVLTYLCARRPILLAVPEVNLAARTISSEAAGLTVAPSDTEAYVTAAERLYADSELARRSAENARRYAERAFDIESIAADFSGIITGNPTPTTSAESGQRTARHPEPVVAT